MYVKKNRISRKSPVNDFRNMSDFLKLFTGLFLFHRKVLPNEKYNFMTIKS